MGNCVACDKCNRKTSSIEIDEIQSYVQLGFYALMYKMVKFQINLQIPKSFTYDFENEQVIQFRTNHLKVLVVQITLEEHVYDYFQKIYTQNSRWPGLILKVKMHNSNSDFCWPLLTQEQAEFAWKFCKEKKLISIFQKYIIPKDEKTSIVEVK